MIRLLISLILLSLALGSLWAVPPLLNYAGQVSVDGQRFDGEAKLKFALVNPAGSVTYWSQDGTSENGSEPIGHVITQVRGGLYSILIGNTAISGMGELNASVFQQHDDVHLRVWFSDGVNGFERIVPDRPFAAVPYALSAGSADITPGSISMNMLDTEVQNSLSGTIPNDRLSTDVNNALKPLIAKQPSTVAAVGGSSTLLSVDATGVNNSYQWKKNGEDLEGATSRTLSITDLNASQHEGNYTVVVSNAFGSVTSSVAQIDVDGSLTEGLVGWWKFDETEGNVASDSSGNGNDGNLTNGPTWTDGKIGGALSFDGVDDYVEISSRKWNIENLFSVSFWYLNNGTNGTIFSLGTPPYNNEIMLWILDGRQDFYYHKAGGNWARIHEPTLSQDWHHKTITVNGGYQANQMSSFINGNLYQSTYTYGGISGLLSDVEDRVLRFGYRINGEHYFNGLIDDIRVYDRVLSAVEVKALYELGEQPVQESGSGTTTVVNGTVADGSITKSMLSQEVLDELNASGGATGSVPGSLIAVPANQSAPSGYELYQRGEPKELVWEEKAPLAVARMVYDGVSVLDDKIYLAGGWNDNHLKLAEVYNPISNEWTAIAELNTERSEATLANLNGKLYAIGGKKSGVVLDSVEKYDVSSNTWSSSTALPSATWYLSSVSYGDKIFIAGGMSSGTLLNDFLSFDETSNNWTVLSDMPTARRSLVLVSYKDRIWAIGGKSNSPLTTVESFNPENNSWQTEANLNTPREYPFVWLANDTIYVGGGSDATVKLNTIERYDSISKKWIPCGYIPETLVAGDTAIVKDTLYLIGGRNSDTHSNKVYAADLNASMEGVHDLYVKTGDASSGTPTVQAEVADGSIVPSKLSSEVSNALKPVVVGQPTSVASANGGSTYLSVNAIGGDTTYQWKKDGVDITGATSRTLSIADLNASRHEGNYTVVVSNAFGSVTSSVAQIDVNGSLTEGLVGWWKFDGDANDTSGNGNHGIVNGATLTTDRFGNTDSAYLFSGTSPHILISNDFGSTVTISIWVSKFNEFGEMVWCFGNQGTGPDLMVTENKICLNTWDSTTNSFGNFAHERNKWYNFVTVISSDKTKQYVDGVLLGAAAYRSPAGKDFYISMKESGQGDYAWTGLLDDVRIYDRALSAVEVKALYELGEQPVQESGSGTTTVVNGTVADGSITKSMLSQEVLDELNATGGATGSVPGSLIAVPANQSAPSGYELYQMGDRKNLVWEEKAPVRVARTAFDGGSVLDGKIYFVGGVIEEIAQNVCERYDPESDSWEDIASLLTARKRIASAVLNGKVYAVGGYNSTSLASVEIFDPTTNNWEETTPLPVAVHDSSAISLNNKIYLVGGRNDSGVLGSLYCFDPSNSSWEEKASLSVPRFSARLAFFNDRIWAIGGYANGQESALVESYSPELDSWQIEPSLVTPRNLLTVWSTNKSIYVLGGSRNSLDHAKLNTLERFDYLAGNWVLDGSFIEPVNALSSVVYKDTAYVFGASFESGVSSLLYAADLNASVEGVHDLYVKTGDASTGTPTVQAEVADGSITANQLSEQILKYLKPEITQQPTTTSIFADTNHTISVSAEGKYLTYQWKKNGVNLAGETNATLTITDANATQHDGNYSVVVSNDFGSVESNVALTNIWMVGENIASLVLWLDASREDSFVLNNSIIQNWKDLSGQGNDMNITDGNASLTGQLNGKTVAVYDGDDTTATTKNFSNDLDQSGYSIVALSRYAGNPSLRVISSGYSGGSRNWLLGHHDGKHSTFFAENWVDPGTTGDLNWHVFSVTHEPAISYNNGVAPLSSFWLDGTNRVQNSGLSSDTAPSPSDIVFGGALTTEKSNCEVAEFIMLGGEISDSDRQKLEGYIAHKWGLSAILPSTHPYKN